MRILEDMRQYIDRLCEEGEIQPIEAEVDWNLEIGAIIRRSNDLMAPAPFFQNISGYPSGFRILGAPASASRRKGRFYSRIALSLGFEPETRADQLIDALSRIMEKPRIPPRLLPTGPCKECVFVGNEVDLFKLPAPYLHDGDGGRYIGTWHTVITRTPDKAWTNWGMYRLMISGQRALGGLIVPTQHIGMHYDLWRGAGQDMPFAVALGTDPVTSLLSSMSIPDGVDEADIVGGYRGKPLDVVRCETVDLEVPASAEIVIEGTVSLTETCMEGPFGEYTGYISNSQKQRPVFKVSAITHRKDPILPVVCPGEPVDDHLCMSLSLAADALALLRKKSIPVVMTFIPSEAALHLLVVSVDKSQWQGDSIAHAVGEAIWSAKIGTLLPKIILVDRDIDPTEIGKVLWAFATKCHPQHGIATFPNRDIFPLTPYLYPEEKRDRKCTMVVFDCTWPSVWPQDYAPRKAGFDSLWPLAMQERVLDSWPRYGYRAN